MVAGVVAGLVVAVGGDARGVVAGVVGRGGVEAGGCAGLVVVVVRTVVVVVGRGEAAPGTVVVRVVGDTAGARVVGVVGRGLAVVTAATGGREATAAVTVTVCVTVIGLGAAGTGGHAGHAPRMVTVAAGAETVTVRICAGGHVWTAGRVWTTGVDVILMGVEETWTVGLGVNLVVVFAGVGDLKTGEVGVLGRCCGKANEEPTRATRKARAYILSVGLVSETKPEKSAQVIQKIDVQVAQSTKKGEASKRLFSKKGSVICI